MPGRRLSDSASSHRSSVVVLLTGVLLLGLANPTMAAVQEPFFSETLVSPPGPLAGATGMAWAADGSDRLFVTIKGGAIRIVKNGVLLAQPFATVAPILNTSECGLTGIAFDPAFLVTRFVYVIGCVSATEQQIIRYTADGDVGTAKTIVVAGLPTAGANHDGGGIGIGPDGKLYWSIGDLGSASGVGADLVSNASKVGRANPDGTPVADNPFFDGPGPNGDFIWARGFRNPFTLTFQPATGLLWVNDVGTSYEQIFIVQRGDHAGWSQHENNQPAGFITPVIAYRTNGVDSQVLATTGGAVRVGDTVTFTTTEPHKFRRGQKIIVTQVPDLSFDGTHFVTSVPTATTFTSLQPGPDATAGSGTATTVALGGSVTGGAFYDSTGFPASYRGNFFFGDYVLGRVMRAAIDPRTNQVTAVVEHWAGPAGHLVDMAVGPDGSLYYIAYDDGVLHRASYIGGEQGLVVTPTNVWIGDGQPAAVMVRLALKPETGAGIAVSVSRSGGDSDVDVMSGNMLRFNDTNWNQPQRVTVAAGFDLDTTNDVGTVTVSAADLSPVLVTVHGRDQAGPDLRDLDA